jgi:LytS/YehU family sensor histidine kinase
LWYTNPSKIRYRYRVEGLDQNWKYTGEPTASFYHLPPGNYKFVAQASLNEYFYQPATTSFTFRMLAPFWKRPLFIILVAGGLIGLAFWFMKWRETRLKQESERKKKMLEAQFQTLKSQINPHFLFNSFNTLASTIEENPDAAVEFVEHLSDFYRSILQYREKNVIPLEEEIVMVKNYMYLLKKRFGDQVSLNISLNGKPKYIAPLSLQLLVENAVKHNVISKSKPLHIDIQVDSNDFITISNNLQKKRSLRSSTNYGLTSLVERYKLLSEHPVQIIQTKDSFTVKIPSIKNIEV